MPVRYFLTNLLLLVIGAALLLACSEPVTPDPILGSVSATPTRMLTTQPVQSPTARPTQTETVTPLPLPTHTPVPSPTSSATPTELPFNVTGKICFPGVTIPPMTAFFEDTGAGTVSELPISENQDSYDIKLAPGTYIAYAWLADYSQGGLYSHAVTCGLNENCDDHGVQPFSIQKDQILEGIDLCDWYAGPFNVPYPPGVDKGDFTGGISGRLNYRDSNPVALRVVAFSTETGYWYWVNTEPNQAFYGINNLPPGSYHVVAYDTQGRAGGHATDKHQLIEVLVIAGELTEGADINDWNASPDAFPPDPTR
jgi:hypothetical protein